MEDMRSPLETEAEEWNQDSYKKSPIELSILEVLNRFGKMTREAIVVMIPYTDKQNLMWIDPILDRLISFGQIRCIEDKWFTLTGK